MTAASRLVRVQVSAGHVARRGASVWEFWALLGASATRQPYSHSTREADSTTCRPHGLRCRSHLPEQPTSGVFAHAYA